MAFRYTSAGRECVANDVDELERALRAGEIDKTTPVLDDSVGARLQAGALIMMKRREMPRTAPASPTAPAAAPKPASAPKAQPAYARSQSDTESDPGRVRRHRVIATIVAIVAFLAICDVGHVPPVVVSDFTGGALVVLFLVVLLSGLIFGRKTDGQKIRQAWVGAAAWAFAWLALVVWIGTIRTDQRAADIVTAKAIADETRKRADQAQAMMADQQAKSEALADAVSSPGYSPPTTVPPPAAPSSSSPGAVQGGKGSMTQRLAPVIAATQAASRKETDEYNAYFESLNLGAVITPQNLTSVAGRKRNAETIERFVAAFDAHHQRSVDMLKWHRENLVAAFGDHPGRAEFTAGVDKSVAESMAELEEMREIQHGVAAKMRAINDFIAARAGTVSMQDGHIVFQTDADVAAFQKMANEIVVLADREDKLQAKRVAELRHAADKIENMPK